MNNIIGKRFIASGLFLVLLLSICALAETASGQQIIRCPEQEFSVLCDQKYSNWTFDEMNGITIYTGKGKAIPYVLVYRSEDWLVDVADYVHEQYTPHIQAKYGDDLVSFVEYEDFSVGGRKMQAAALYTYMLQGYTIEMLRVYDVQNRHTVVFTAKYISGQGDETLAVLDQVVNSYQPDPDYYR